MNEMKYKKKAEDHAQRILEQVREKALTIALFGAHDNVTRTIAALENTKSEIRDKGFVDEFLVTLWYPDQTHVLWRSILAVGTTGVPLFEKISSAYGWNKAETDQYWARQALLDKAAHRNAEEIKSKKQREAQWQSECEKARQLGISPERLRELQQANQEANENE